MGNIHKDPCKVKWLPLVGCGVYNIIATNHKHFIGVDFADIPEGVGYHSTCYKNFTHKKTLELAEKRAQRDVQPAAVSEGGGGREGVGESRGETPRKKLRSRSSLTSAGPVLPPVCIICKKAKKMMSVGGKKQLDVLSQAETMTAGRLQLLTSQHTHTHTHTHIKN